MNILASILGVVGGGLNSVLGLISSTMQAGFKAAIQFHKEGIAFARDAGLSAKQAQAYTNVLIQRTQVLANKYGVSADAIMQVQRGLSEATGKQLMLNNAQAESFVQIDKMMGAQSRAKFTEEIMNGMGGQVDTVTNAMAKVYATAAKQGLNAKKLTDKVAQNLSMANRLSFRNGIDGITRMAALSEKLGINMASVETAAGQFLELDKAIENAAHMQMLGGSAAANFGNPLTAAYEANYDPEAFAERMSKSLGSYATFDASRGVASINGMNMDFVRNVAKTMGISVDDASKMAKKQAEVRYKEGQFGNKLNALGLSEDQKNYIINNAQVTNGGKDLQLNGQNLNELLANPNKLKEMMSFEGKSDTDILRDQAMTLTSIDEKISGASAAISASFAEGISGYLGPIGDKIKEFAKSYSTYVKQWGTDTGKVIGKAMHWIDTHADEISTVLGGIFGGVSKLFNLISEYTKTAIGIFLGWKVLKGVLGANIGGGKTLGGRAASAVGRGIWKGTKAVGRGIGKFAKIGGAALGAGIGVFNAVSAQENYASKRKELNEQLNSGAILKADYDAQVNEARVAKNASVGEGIGTAAGAVIGTALGGPVGAAIGGWLGGTVGKFLGENWDSITKTAKDIFKKIWGGIKDFGKIAWEGIKWLADNNPIGLMVKGIGKLFGKDWSITKGIGAIFGGGDTKKHAEGGFINEGAVGVESPVLAQKGEVILNPTQQKNFMALANDTTVKAKEYGAERKYIYKPNGSETSNVNGSTITVKDFNINLSGTLKLDAGNATKNIDMNSLLNDYQFMNTLKDMIKQSINADMNGGRFMNDLATRRGQISSTSIIGH